MASLLTPEFVARILRDVDAWGSKKWPVQWIRVRRASAGWKTVCGALLFYAPDIMAHAPRVASALGMEDATAMLVTKWIGMVLFGIGVLDKYLKFKRPIESRARARSVTSNSGEEHILAPVSSAQVAPVPIVPKVVAKMSPTQQVVFDSVFESEVKRGATLEVARAAAVDAVWKAFPAQAKESLP